jgi:AraC-like DNA-binding protein
MQIVGQGRIVVWDGASLWVLASATEHAQTAFHSHHAIQITFGLAGAFQLRTPDEALSGPVVAVAPDANHIFEAHGEAAFLFIEPDGAVGRALSRLWFGDGPLKKLDSQGLEALLSELSNAFRRVRPDEELVSIGQRLVAALASGIEHSAPEERVAAMVRFVTENLDEPLTLPMVAAHAGLSPGRASHLFVEQTGLPLRTYVLWRRVARAVELYSDGLALTEAAHSAGFADSAHLSRTFRRMFGVPAASLRLSAA